MSKQNQTKLGKHFVTRMGYGAMQLPGPGVWGPPRDRETALSVLLHAVELGVNHIDTAYFYGHGVSNELIRSALHPYSDDLVLVSKIGAKRDSKGGWIPAQHPADLRIGVEENLRSLDVEQLSVMNLRLMDSFRDGSRIPDEQCANLDDQLAEMIKLRDEGKIGDIGLSNATLGQLRQALPAGIVCVQNAYSLLDRKDEALLKLCTENNIAWVPFFPLGSAFCHLPKVTEHPEVVSAATRLGATPAQIGLAWLLAHSPNILLIPGTSNLHHLEENVASGAIYLDEKTMDILDHLKDN